MAGGVRHPGARQRRNRRELSCSSHSARPWPHAASWLWWFGIVALAWPSVTVLALVILFAVYAFITAGLKAAGLVVR